MQPRVKVISNGESRVSAAECRQVLVGPGVNQPEPFPGYRGFVGWECPALLPNGEMLVTFSAGYWHASPPTPWLLGQADLEEYLALGIPTDIDAPTGGRAMMIRSSDGGRSWSRPETLINTPHDDRSPAACVLSDGTLVCSFFTSSGAPYSSMKHKPELATRTHVLRSLDGGRTWQPATGKLPSPFLFDAADGPPIELRDGSVLLVVYGSVLAEDKPRVWSQAIFRSLDRGNSWRLQGTMSAPYELTESSIAQLPGGRLVLIARSLGVVSWSDDLGVNWSKLAPFGIAMFDPGLLVLRDGTLVCIHGSYDPDRPRLRVIFSIDGGATWFAPAERHGFLLDETYGYARGIELPDGSIYVAYIKSGAHSAEDARTNAIFALRFRIRHDRAGIDILPATEPAGCFAISHSI